MTKKSVLLLLFSPLVFVLCFLAIEVGLRVLWPLENIPQREFDSELGWRGRPNLVCDLHEKAFKIRIEQNSEGFRDRQHDTHKSKDTLRILCLGDSFTWGWGVEQTQIYTSLLEHMLQGHRPSVEVINAGVGGYGTDHSLLYYQLRGSKYEPDYVIYQACENDVPGNVLSRAEGRYNKPYYSLTDQGELVLNDCPVPPLNAKARLIDFISRRSRLAYFAKHRSQYLQNRLERGSRRSASGINRAAAESGSVTYAFRLFCAEVRELDRRCNDQGSEFILLMDFTPSPEETVYWAQACGDIRKVDLRGYLNQQEERLGKRAYISDDGHWTEEGHEWVAMKVRDLVAG